MQSQYQLARGDQVLPFTRRKVLHIILIVKAFKTFGTSVLGCPAAGCWVLDHFDSGFPRFHSAPFRTKDHSSCHRFQMALSYHVQPHFESADANYPLVSRFIISTHHEVSLQIRHESAVPLRKIGFVVEYSPPNCSWAGGFQERDAPSKSRC